MNKPLSVANLTAFGMPPSSLGNALVALGGVATRTGQSLAVVERTGRRAEETPLHVHPHDELILVHDGELTLLVGDDAIELRAGETFVAPADVAHALVVESPRARYTSATVVRSAARYEDFLRAVGLPVGGGSGPWHRSDDAARLGTIASRNGIRVLAEPGHRPSARALSSSFRS